MMFLFIYYLYICHTYEFIVFKLSNGMDKKDVRICYLLHCRSEKYLSEEIWREVHETN